MLPLFDRYNLQHVHRVDNEEADALSRAKVVAPPVAESAEKKPTHGSNRVLTRQQAALCRWWYLKGKCTNTRLLGRIFDLADGPMWNLCTGRTYKDLNETDMPTDQE